MYLCTYVLMYLCTYIFIYGYMLINEQDETSQHSHVVNDDFMNMFNDSKIFKIETYHLM